MITIEEKARAYDEALERAKRLYNDGNSPVAPTIEAIFPELKESEDDKIRKELISFFSDLPDTDTFRGIPPSKVIAWLEKQGEQKVSEYDVVKTIKERIIEYFDNHLIIDKCFSIGGLKDDILKIINEVKFTKQSEQKPQGKTEPKFKVGDYLVNDYCKGKVIALTDDAYLLDTEQGIPFSCEHNAHLWTIQDAKDGDVLIDKSCNRENPFIFKETKPSDIKTDMLNPLTVLGYCGIGGAGFTKGEGWGDTANCIYYPATKEQRDTLMKAMADAGYTFDFEKKELKKIENEIEIPFGAKDSELQEATYYIPKGFHAEIDGNKVIIKKGEQKPADETPYPETLEKAIDLYYYSYGNGEGEFEHLSLEKFRDIVHTFVSDYEQKSSWSEEDEKNIDFVIKHVGLVAEEKKFAYIFKWLKSLKDRVQPKRECSEEDEHRINDTIYFLETAKKHYASIVELDACINWLKSLKDRVVPQSRQEWSDKDMNFLTDVEYLLRVVKMENRSDNEYQRAENCLAWLKSLRPQSQWKPSDEQINVCKKVYADILSAKGFDLGTVNSELNRLEEELKKLKGE